MKLVFKILALSAFLLSSAQAKTIYTGDTINKVPVITKLDVNDLSTGKHRFMFQGVEMQTGQHWYVPVMVTKGAKVGKKILLQAGVHGDELNGINVLHKLFSQLNPEKMQGTVIGVVGPNRSGIENMSRYWDVNISGGYTIDFNRIFPGKEFGNPPEKHAWLLWEKLYKNNVDVALDFHTSSTGHDFPLFIYADFRNPEIQTMAELVPADQIKNDPGEKGTVETTFVSSGIPAMTVELGNPRTYNKDIISRGLEGTQNILVHYKIIPGKIKRTAKTQKTYIADKMHSIKATTGGFATILVNIGDWVKVGQLVAIQKNAFGDTIKEYKATKAGKVLSVGSDATRENGSLLVRLLYQSPAKK